MKKKLLRKILRYLLMFFVVYVIAKYAKKDELIIATSAVIVFTLLDMYFPLLINET